MDKDNITNFTNTNTNINMFSQQALDAATSALMAFPRHITLRAKTMFLIHGLIPCLGEGLLRGLTLTALLALVQGGDGKDLMEVS